MNRFFADNAVGSVDKQLATRQDRSSPSHFEGTVRIAPGLLSAAEGAARTIICRSNSLLRPSADYADRPGTALGLLL